MFLIFNRTLPITLKIIISRSLINKNTLPDFRIDPAFLNAVKKEPALVILKHMRNLFCADHALELAV